MRRVVVGLLALVATAAVLASPAAPASSPRASDTETFELQPGLTAKQKHTASTEFTGNGTDVTISGTITEKFPSGAVCVYDAFYYNVCGGTRFQQQTNIRFGNEGSTGDPVPFVPPFGTIPPFSSDHTYSFTSGTTGRFYFWAWPFGRPDKGATYSGSFKMSLRPVHPAGCPSSRGAGAVASAVQNEVRVLCADSGCQFHKGGSAPAAWLPLSADTVLKQGDNVDCGPDAKAVIAFSDNSTVALSDVSDLQIATFFTDGGVVKAEILIKMGQVAAQVKHSEATKSDFRIKSPTATASVRGTIFSVFYDPGSKTMVTSVNESVVTVDPAKPGLPTVNVPAGKEVEVTAKAMSAIAPIGKSDLRGGISRIQARDLVLARIAAKAGRCRLVVPRTGAFSVKPKGRAWLVSIKATGGKVKGTSTWRAAGTKVTPVNARAKKIARGCR